jgi:hypothetical protein
MLIANFRIVLATAAFGIVSSAAAVASDCTQTSVGLTPISDLGTGLYLGQFAGGLYPNGLNSPPTEHHALGLVRASAVMPRDAAGNPDPTGRYVLISIGMSNTTQEFCCGDWTFMGQAAANPAVNHTALAIVNGASGGQTAMTWDSPTDPNYDRVRDTQLAPRGLSEAQVQAAWVKVADAQPTSSLPNSNADAFALQGFMGSIARAMKVRYPNLQLVFFSSRIYAGYASTALNPEPYAYESGFAVKWVIESQIDQMAGGGIEPISGDLDANTVAPWLAWGPYLWADGLTPRSDGLIWRCQDVENDGTHPAQPGEEKVADVLLAFMLTSRYTTPWFRGDFTPCPGDLNQNGEVDLQDLTHLLSNFGRQSGATRSQGDTDGDGDVDLNDLATLLSDFGRTCD